VRLLILLFPALLAAQINTAKLVDLTWPYDDKTIYWPTGKPFQWEKESWGMSPGGYWYASGRYAASEHGGTHLDAPVHFGQGKPAMDEIPLAQLVAPAIVVDISASCAKNSDYRLTAADLASDTPGDTAHLHFPGIAPDAAKFLAEQRRIVAAGIDTASIDHGPSKDFMTHRILNGAGIYGLENVANIDKVPLTGATLIALPMKIKGGSGGPVRIVALLP
jgi:kynurenine formamidase